ncbi:MAG: type II toxin-antitoxin system VapC family toxin [Anaerolineales bacterium]|nr:type II toxin-antitoxin system VapC family toxin [Anaerolineales bacterium]
MNYLLDTCVISELVAKQPNSQVVEWIDSLDNDLVYLSAITIGEITKGIEKLPQSSRKQTLNEWLKRNLLARFHGKILSLDTAVLIEWGSLTARLESSEQIMPAIDSLIAATALAHQMTLATRNVGDFEAANVKIINPWK